MVRREHARRRPAFLRLHAKGFPLARRIHGQPARANADRSNAARALEKLRRCAGFISQRAAANFVRFIRWPNAGAVKRPHGTGLLQEMHSVCQRLGRRCLRWCEYQRQPDGGTVVSEERA